MPKLPSGSGSLIPPDAGVHTSSVPASKYVGRLRWSVCAMLFYATTLNYMDRQVLGILAPTLQHTIGWTEAQYGYIIGAFQAAYAVGLMLAGRMVDKLGTRIGYAIVMGLWSLAAMSHALARTTLEFGIARMFLGFGESGNFPAAIKTTAEWFPQRERSLATGIFNSGSNVGAILAPAIVPWITLRFGWRPAFLSTGIFSTAWIIWWLIRYRTPAEHARLTKRESDYIHSDLIPATPRIPWTSLLTLRQTWAFSLGKFLTDPIWWFYLYWLPKFFASRFNLQLAQLALPLIVVYNVSAIGSIAGGWLPTFLSSHGMRIARARAASMLACACLVVPIALIGRLPSEWMAIGVLSVAAAAHQGWSANLFTTVSDMFPQSSVGAVAGIGGTAGSVGGVLFALGTGWLLQLTHSYTLLFVVSGSAYMVALLFILVLAPGFQRIGSRLAPLGPADEETQLGQS
jgi:MFS transporter, ACS family, hexuronate transporter